MGWGDLNLLASTGAFVIAASAAVFVLNAARSLRHGALAGNDPWVGDTLEWATSSPPPPYNFHPPPVVDGREALWACLGRSAQFTGLATDRREALVTTALDAEPDNRYESPGPTIWPLVAAFAIGVMFIGAVFTLWALVVGALLLTPALILWGWPKKRKEEEHRSVHGPLPKPA